MKTIKIFASIIAISLISASALAQSLSVTADTLDAAEAKIAVKAAERGAHYTITSATVNNHVYMTARLDK